MRYVEKGESPVFFETCKAELPDNPLWRDFDGNAELSQCKKKLHSYLTKEQSGLCIYCERKLTDNNAHIEHIYPKDQDSGFPELAFEYSNLAVSCNGDQCEPPGVYEIFNPEDIASCGHKKENHLEVAKFLHPVKEENIREQFTYNKDTGAIQPADENVKAEYTIDLLNLNNPRLNLARLNAPQAVFDVLENSNNPLFYQLGKQRMVEVLLDREKPFPFISFLKFYFSKPGTTA